MCEGYNNRDMKVADDKCIDRANRPNNEKT
ncbi:unnamed protein product [Ectocarpus sp. CCAP 1310/34]|nr:unnamed protein product [Ectocarpus sp. CCAP 1310/34]